MIVVDLFQGHLVRAPMPVIGTRTFCPRDLSAAVHFGFDTFWLLGAIHVARSLVCPLRK